MHGSSAVSDTLARLQLVSWTVTSPAYAVQYRYGIGISLVASVRDSES